MQIGGGYTNQAGKPVLNECIGSMIVYAKAWACASEDTLIDRYKKNTRMCMIGCEVVRVLSLSLIVTASATDPYQIFKEMRTPLQEQPLFGVKYLSLVQRSFRTTVILLECLDAGPRHTSNPDYLVCKPIEVSIFLMYLDVVTLAKNGEEHI